MDPSVGPFKGGLQDFPAGLGLRLNSQCRVLGSLLVGNQIAHTTAKTDDLMAAAKTQGSQVSTKNKEAEQKTANPQGSEGRQRSSTAVKPAFWRRVIFQPRRRGQTQSGEAASPGISRKVRGGPGSVPRAV